MNAWRSDAIVSPQVGIRVFDAETGDQVLTLSRNVSGTAVAFSPDSRRIVSGSVDGPVTLWDVETGEQMLVLNGHSDSVYGVAFSREGRRIVSGSYDGTLMIWDARDRLGEVVQSQ